MGFIGFSVWSTYQVLFFVALGIIFIMCIIMGIQSAKAADRKQDIKQKIIDYEKDIADRNRVISKPRYITIHSKQRYKGRTRKANARTIRNDTSKMRKGNPQRISWGLCYAILFLRIRRLLRLEISPVTSG